MLFFISEDEPEFEYSGKKGDFIRINLPVVRGNCLFRKNGTEFFQDSLPLSAGGSLVVGCGTAAENYHDRRFYYEERVKWYG